MGDNLHGCDSQGSQGSLQRAVVKTAGRDGPGQGILGESKGTLQMMNPRLEFTARG
jgi:hypothetical protein